MFGFLLRFVLVLGFCGIVSGQEICDNQIDDDNNGLTDCEDRACYFDAEVCPAFNKGTLTCPVAGELPDILGTEVAFKDDNLSLDSLRLKIPTGSKNLKLVIQGNFEGASNTDSIDFGTNPVAWGDDRLIYGIVDIDLENQHSSGMVEYLSNNLVAKRYVWQKQNLGLKSD